MFQLLRREHVVMGRAGREQGGCWEPGAGVGLAADSLPAPPPLMSAPPQVTNRLLFNFVSVLLALGWSFCSSLTSPSGPQISPSQVSEEKTPQRSRASSQETSLSKEHP